MEIQIHSRRVYYRQYYLYETVQRILPKLAKWRWRLSVANR